MHYVSLFFHWRALSLFYFDCIRWNCTTHWLDARPLHTYLQHIMINLLNLWNLRILFFFVGAAGELWHMPVDGGNGYSLLVEYMCGPEYFKRRVTSLQIRIYDAQSQFLQYTLCMLFGTCLFIKSTLCIPYWIEIFASRYLWKATAIHTHSYTHTQRERKLPVYGGRCVLAAFNEKKGRRRRRGSNEHGWGLSSETFSTAKCSNRNICGEGYTANVYHSASQCTGTLQNVIQCPRYRLCSPIHMNAYKFEILI